MSYRLATLLAIVAFSCRQTIHAYPTGGGAYIVAKENIGPTAGLIAGASLLQTPEAASGFETTVRRPGDALETIADISGLGAAGSAGHG